VDEALTGLKSSLAIKIYGPDLSVLQDKAVQMKNVLTAIPGFKELTVVRETGPAQPPTRRGPRQDRALWN